MRIRKKSLYMTEQSVTAWPGEGALGIGGTGKPRNDWCDTELSRSVLLWNLAADPQNGPHTNNGDAPDVPGRSR